MKESPRFIGDFFFRVLYKNLKYPKKSFMIFKVPDGTFFCPYYFALLDPLVIFTHAQLRNRRILFITG